MRTSGRVGGFECLAVLALLVLGAALRCWRLDLGWFGVDQARDIQTALDIVAGHDWPTVGPTMRRVTSLGALYYYFWALPHLLSDDPLAAYRFAAGLGVVALLLTWAFARRFWGRHAALVTLAILATARVAVIDGRVAWAPAALPIVAVSLLWMLAAAPTVWRLAGLGAVLGLAVQLHLTMVAWGMAAVLLIVGQRPGWRPLVAGGLGFVLTGFSAVYAVFANAGHDAGIATLPSRGPVPSILGRVLAALTLGWRVPTAFWQWGDAPEVWPFAARLAAVLIVLAALLGIVRLFVAARRGSRASTVVLTVMICQLGMVTFLPGEAWYYYLDAALPLWALAAGALFATPTRETRMRLDRRARCLTAAVVVAAALLLGVCGAWWLVESARHGYVVVSPAALTLDGIAGRDAATPGRLVTAGVKQAVATALATEPASFPARWLATHGPAFDDATGDNGFWIWHASSSAPTSGPSLRHTALWFRDDPGAPVAPAVGFELFTLGPLLLARYEPTIAYDACHDEHGPIVVPVRVVPHPRRYGDGTMVRSPALPARIDCAVAAGAGATRVVASVTSGTVALRDAAGVRAVEGQTSTMCVRRGTRPEVFTIEIAHPAGTAGDLDLYERPDPDCAAEKIAP